LYINITKIHSAIYKKSPPNWRAVVFASTQIISSTKRIQIHLTFDPYLPHSSLHPLDVLLGGLIENFFVLEHGAETIET
jgi:hypothetical protein